MAQTDPMMNHNLSVTMEPMVTGAGGALRAALDRLGQLGFRFVQLSATQAGMRPRDLDHSARRDLLASLKRRGFQVSGLDVWIPPKHFIDPGQVDRAVSALKQAVELAGDLGRCPVSFTLPDQSAAPGQPPGQEGDSMQSVIKAIMAHAQRFGVMAADHAVPWARMTIEHMGVGIDPAAWLSRAGDPAAAALKAGENLVSARLCDLLTSGMRGPIGDQQQGQLDVMAYKAALAAIGFSRPVVIDARHWVDPWQGIAQSKREWEEMDGSVA